MKYDDWLTKEEAAARLGVSERTVMRLADDGKIQQRTRPRPGGSPLAVYHPGDVEKVASERAAADGRVFVMPADATAPSGASGPPAVTQVGSAIAAAVAQELGRIATPPAPASTVPIADKPRVTLHEAVQLGYRADDLRERVKAGTLENVGTPHRYRFRRRDLDAL